MNTQVVFGIFPHADQATKLFQCPITVITPDSGQSQTNFYTSDTVPVDFLFIFFDLCKIVPLFGGARTPSPLFWMLVLDQPNLLVLDIYS